MSSGKDAATEGSGASLPPGRRRWRLVAGVLGVAVLLLGLLVALLPTLLSTGPGRNLVLSQVNKLLLGRVQVERLSLGWFSGAEIDGIQVFDADNRLAVTAARLQTQLTVWNLLRGRLDLGEVVLEKPNLVLLEFDADGRTNLEKMAVSTSDAPLVLPAVSAKVRITDFTATLQGPPIGPPIRVEPSQITAELPNLADAPVKLAVELSIRRDGVPTVGRLELSGEVKAVSGGQIDLAGLRATLKVTGDRLALALAEPLLRGSGLTAAGLLDVRLDVTAAGLETAGASGQLTVMDLDVGGELLKGDRVRTPRVNVPLSVKLTPAGAGDRRLSIERLAVESELLQAAVSGELTDASLGRLASLAAPEVPGRVMLEVRVPSVAAVAAAMPNLLGLQQGVTLSGGSAGLQVETSWSGGEVSVKADASLSDVAGTRAGRAVRLEPLRLTADATAKLRPAGVAAGGAAGVAAGGMTGGVADVNVRGLEFVSGFGSGQARGTLSDLTYRLELDLDRLRQQAEQFVALPVAELAGRLAATGSLQGEVADDRAPVLARLRSEGTGVRLATRAADGSAGQVIDIDRLVVETETALLPQGESRFAVADVRGLKVTAGPEGQPLAQVEATARAELAGGDVAAFDLRRLDLHSLPDLQRRYGALVPALQELALTFPTGVVRASVAGRYVGGTLETSRPLDLQLVDLSVLREGRRVLWRDTLRLRTGLTLTTAGPMDAKLSGLSLTTQSGLLAVEQVGELLQVTMASAGTGGRVTGQGRVRVAANLAAVAEAVAAYTGQPQDPAQAVRSGRLDADVALSSPADGPSQVRLAADLSQLTVGDRVRDQQVRLVLDARSADGFSSADVTADVSSPVVNVTLREAKVNTAAATVFDTVPSARLSVRSDDLAQLDALLAPLLGQGGGDALRVVSGTLDLQLRISRAGNTLQAELTRLASENLQLQKAAAVYRVPEPVSLTGQLAAATTEDGRLDQLTVAALDGSLGVARMTVRQPVRLTGLTTDRPDFAGAVDVSGRLQTVLGLVETLQGQPPGSTYPYVGEFVLSQQVATQGPTSTAVGSVRVTGLQLLDRNGRTLFTEDRLELTNDLTYVASGRDGGGGGGGGGGGSGGGSGGGVDELRLRELSVRFVSSEALSVTASGTLRDLSATRTLVEPLRVTVGYDLARLIPLVLPLLDESTRRQLEGVEIAGRHESRFEVLGSYPAETVADVPVRSLGVTGGVRLDRVFVPSYGVDLRQVDARFAMREGLVVLTLPAPASLNDGRLNLTGVTLDLNPTTPRLNVPKGQVLVEDVALNRVIADRLGRFLGPLFVNTDRASGKLRIRSEGVDKLPLGDLLTATTPENDGRAEFVVNIDNLELVGGFAGDFVRAIPIIGNFFIGNVPEARFVIQRGVVSQDLPIIVGSQVTGELRFTGNIELAEPQRLNPLQVRVGSNLLRDRIPLVRDIARVADPVFVIRGTVRQPRLDLVGGIQQWIRDQAGGILPGLLGR
ncbi:MAG: hypothetical protein ACK4PI_10030 [Tepidisphaerales bacterium]